MYSGCDEIARSAWEFQEGVRNRPPFSSPWYLFTFGSSYGPVVEPYFLLINHSVVKVSSVVSATESESIPFQFINGISYRGSSWVPRDPWKSKTPKRKKYQKIRFPEPHPCHAQVTIHGKEENFSISTVLFLSRSFKGQMTPLCVLMPNQNEGIVWCQFTYGAARCSLAQRAGWMRCDASEGNVKSTFGSFGNRYSSFGE